MLLANAHPSMSHVSPDFVPVFGDCLRMMRQVLFAPEAQPVITAGSGTLGWDHVAANVCEPGDEVLVLNSGYFGDCEWRVQMAGDAALIHGHAQRLPSASRCTAPR